MSISASAHLTAWCKSYLGSERLSKLLCYSWSFMKYEPLSFQVGPSLGTLPQPQRPLSPFPSQQYIKRALYNYYYCLIILYIKLPCFSYCVVSCLLIKPRLPWPYFFSLLLWNLPVCIEHKACIP